MKSQVYTDSRNILSVKFASNVFFNSQDDNSLLKYVNDTTRSIYAFELSDPPNAYTSVSDGGGDRVTETEPCRTGNSNGDEIGPCTICLEELDGDLKKHGGNGCNFIMCDQCIEVRFLTDNHISFLPYLRPFNDIISLPLKFVLNSQFAIIKSAPDDDNRQCQSSSRGSRARYSLNSYHKRASGRSETRS